jgi:hypothetical protein
MQDAMDTALLGAVVTFIEWRYRHFDFDSGLPSNKCACVLPRPNVELSSRRTLSVVKNLPGNTITISTRAEVVVINQRYL